MPVPGGGAAPRDLDAHLELTENADASDADSDGDGHPDYYHVYFGNMRSTNRGIDVNTWRDAWLDVDDRDGYGPENMYFHVVDGGRYEFYVINYSMEQPLMSSEANVVLYKGNTPIRHWEIPSLYQEYSRWNVFTIYGGKVHAPEHA